MATVPDISKMGDTIKSAMSAVKASIPSTSSIENTYSNEQISAKVSPISLEDLRLRVEKLESQMGKLASAFGNTESSKLRTIESILSGGAKRRTRRYRKARKFNRK